MIALLTTALAASPNVLVTGEATLQLVDDAGTVANLREHVAPGRYKVMIQELGSWIGAGTIQVPDSGDIAVKCNLQMMRCLAEPYDPSMIHDIQLPPKSLDSPRPMITLKDPAKGFTWTGDASVTRVVLFDDAGTEFDGSAPLAPGRYQIWLTTRTERRGGGAGTVSVKDGEAPTLQCNSALMRCVKK